MRTAPWRRHPVGSLRWSFGILPAMTATAGISIVIPTLNCARSLEIALRSIRAQRYPADRLEIIVADGGSTDTTRHVAESWGCTVVENPLVTGEAGKAAGLAHASHEIVGFVDSDNELPSPSTLVAVVDALADPRIAGAEPIQFTALDTMPALDRYFALLGMNDPFVLFLGTYDRECLVTGKWTGVDHEVYEETPTLRKVRFRRERLPTVGANGFFTRRSVAAAAVRDGYLFDVDILHAGTSGPFVHVAKLHLGIAHHYAQSLRQFARKQTRRAQDFLYFSAAGMRTGPTAPPWRGALLFAAATLTVVPLLVQAAIGWTRRPDRAWLYHLPACWITLVVYATVTLRRLLGAARPHSRAEWGG